MKSRLEVPGRDQRRRLLPARSSGTPNRHPGGTCGLRPRLLHRRTRSSSTRPWRSTWSGPTSDPCKTLWVFRYYDLDDRETSRRYGKALVRLITFIRDARAEQSNRPTPKVNIIAHSMGGLIVREAVQVTYPRKGSRPPTTSTRSSRSARRTRASRSSSCRTGSRSTQPRSWSISIPSFRQKDPQEPGRLQERSPSTSRSSGC